MEYVTLKVYIYYINDLKDIETNELMVLSEINTKNKRRIKTMW